MKYLIILSCFFSFFEVLAQKNDQNQGFGLNDGLLLIIEEYLESADGENQIDILELYEYLQEVYNAKLDINTISAQELTQLQLLSDIQINNFLIYRDNYGPFISIYELQAIPSLDINSIKRVLPFLTIEDTSNTLNNRIAEARKTGKHELLLRGQRNLETLKGSREDGGFLGDPYRYYLRYRYQADGVKAGLLAEKDIGEEFFKGSNKAGFDFYSYHVSLKNVTEKITHLILGDYTVSMGQGLILHNQFGNGLTSFTTNVKKRNGTFRQYTSRNEVNYFKGIGVEYDVYQNVSAAVLASQNKIDGTLRDNDDDDIFDAFSSIDVSGNHRSVNEVNKKNGIKRTSLGGLLKYETAASRIAVNFLSESFDKPFDRTLRPDNIFFPRESSFQNISVDYSHAFRGINFFGESAYSFDNGGAHLMGMLLGIDPRLDLSLVYRNYDRDYVAISPNAFGQGSNTQNERGVYFGFEFRPNASFTVNAYADHWKNPWLRFRVDSPGSGNDYLIKIAYQKKRKLNAYVLFKTEAKPRNSSIESAIDFTDIDRITKMRFHISNKISEVVTLRNRCEFSFFGNEYETHNGFMIYQDILFKKIDFPISFTTRFMYFDVSDFDARIYAYENDVLSDFSVPFFNDQGIRYYVNMRYRASKNMTVELRWAQIRYNNRDTISSGLTEIDGSVNTNVKAQVIYKL